MNVLLVFSRAGQKKDRHFLIPSEELKEFDLDKINGLWCEFEDDEPSNDWYREDAPDGQRRYLRDDELGKKMIVESQFVKYETHFRYMPYRERTLYFKDEYSFQVWYLGQLIDTKLKKYENPSLPFQCDKVVTVGI